MTTKPKQNRWFKIKNDAGTIGDVPLDTLKAAVDQVIAQYKETHGRHPNTAEWEALLTVSMDRSEIGIVKTVKIDLATIDDAYDDDEDAPKPPKKTSPLH